LLEKAVSTIPQHRRGTRITKRGTHGKNSRCCPR
jgi:hypothetical protein